MKSVAARGRASSNKASYGGAGLWAEPPPSVGVKQSEMEQGGGRRAEPGENSSRTGVEVRRTGWEEEEEEGCWDVNSGDKEEDSLVLE